MEAFGPAHPESRDIIERDPFLRPHRPVAPSSSTVSRRRPAVVTQVSNSIISGRRFTGGGQRAFPLYIPAAARS